MRAAVAQDFCLYFGPANARVVTNQDEHPPAHDQLHTGSPTPEPKSQLGYNFPHRRGRDPQPRTSHNVRRIDMLATDRSGFSRTKAKAVHTVPAQRWTNLYTAISQRSCADDVAKKMKLHRPHFCGESSRRLRISPLVWPDSSGHENEDHGRGDRLVGAHPYWHQGLLGASPHAASV